MDTSILIKGTIRLSSPIDEYERYKTIEMFDNLAQGCIHSLCVSLAYDEYNSRTWLETKKALENMATLIRESIDEIVKEKTE